MPNIKQPSLSPVQAATAGSSPVVDTSNAEILKAAGKFAALGAEALSKKESAAAAAEKDTIKNAFVDTLVHISKDSFAPQKQPAQPEQLTEAQKAAERINRLEQQTGAADKAALERVVAYQKFSSAYPELAGEFSALFKQQTGQAVVESLRKTEEAKQKAAQDELASVKQRLTDTVTGLGYTVTNETIPELMVKAAPYEDEMVKAQTAARRAEMLKNQRTVRTEHIVAGQEEVLNSGFTGSLISNQLHINALLTDYDPMTASADEKQLMVHDLELAKRSFEVSVRDATDRLDQNVVTTRMKPILDAYDEAISAANGETSLKDLQNSNKIRAEMAMAKLNDLPGFPVMSAALSQLKGVPDRMIAGGTWRKMSTQLAMPFYRMLGVALARPNANPYGGLEAASTPEQLASQYKVFSEVVKDNLDNKEVADNLAKMMQAWTNQFSVAPDEVPLTVLDSMLDVAADPNAIAVLDKSPELPKNLESGFRSYTERLRANVSDALAKEFDKRYEVYKPGQESPVKAGFLGFITKDYAKSFKQPQAAPRLFELIDIKLQKDGSLHFESPSPEAKTNTQIQQSVNTLNRAYGVSFGKLARAYAHMVQHNNDYSAAAKALLESPEWEGAQATLEPTGFKPSTASGGNK